MKIYPLLLVIATLAGCAVGPLAPPFYEQPTPSEISSAAHAVPTWEIHPGLVADEAAWVTHVNGGQTWKGPLRNEYITRTLDLRPGLQTLTVMYVRGRVQVSTDLPVTVVSGQTILVKYERPETTVMDRFAGRDHVNVWLEDRDTGQALTGQVSISIRY
jgi:hypothetical protein